MADKDKDNDGFEDLTESNHDGAQTDPDGDSDGGNTEAEDEATKGDVEPEDELNAPDEAATISSLEATISILQTENALKDQEIERWKNINLQLLLEMPNDASVGTEDEDMEGDDPAPYSSVSGADSLFETKDN